MIIAAQRNKKMRRIHKKHKKWKKIVMQTYFRECEIYVLEKKNWEFNAILQTWKKLEVFWSIIISSFDNLINLTNTNSNLNNENYINMIEKENKSRVTINIYSNENESEISSNSFEAKSNSSSNQEVFENEKDEDRMKKSVDNFNNINEDFIFVINEYFMLNVFIDENSSIQD